MNNHVQSPRVAIVTGAAQGLGRSIAARLFQDGFNIAINDIPEKSKQLEEIAREIEGDSRKAGRVLVALADVSVESEVKASTETLDRVLAVNVRGTFLCYKYASEQMIRQGGGGRIIGASSLAGKRGKVFVLDVVNRVAESKGLINIGQGMLSAYSASKFAIRGLTQAAAVELGKHGITVNAYAPGAIVTEMFHSMSDQMKNGLAARASLGCHGTTDDIANFVSYIVSDQAKFITGQSVTIDGGIHFD
ncbi:hypothetical protein AAF712_002892 [Marasmius tenuissimus]|uniref:NAD(P)-binding protein n=1 Tax=Marasmius tenuissimus TaxID=585030 RepID=A0ABR3A8Y4_9AGAR